MMTTAPALSLCTQIIRGAYPAPPATRSRELRDLIDSILVLDQAKRPGINQILAMPVMKARITKWLSSTLQVDTSPESCAKLLCLETHGAHTVLADAGDRKALLFATSAESFLSSVTRQSTVLML